MIGLCLTVVSFAQSSLISKEIHFHTGTIVFERNVPIPDKTTLFDKREMVDNQFYKLIQFDRIPTLAEQSALFDAGIECLQYIPDHTYLTAITLEAAQNIEHISAISGVYSIPKNLKTHQELKVKNNTSRSKPLQLLIRYFKNITPGKIADLVLQKQKEIIRHYPDNYTFILSIMPDELDEITEWPFVYFIEPLSEELIPEDTYARNFHRANILSGKSGNGLHFDGTDITVAIGDDGVVGPHIDFKARTIQNEVSNSLNGMHGDMVAGILCGAGNLNPSTQGMAPAADLIVLQGFDAIHKANKLYSINNVVITSTSFGDGCNRGYTTLAESADRQIFQNPALMHVFSAGNSGEEDCDYGAGAGWGNITGGVKVGKNIIAVANLDAFGNILPNSSRGPAKDGRIKPDLAANGEGQFSTAPFNDYQIGTGTSAAAPVVAGIMAQLYQAYKTTNNGFNPESALIKAILLNTADDLGNPGPDYTHGWGKVNALRAYQTLAQQHYWRDSVAHNDSISITIYIPPPTRQCKVMLYWNDPEGSPLSNKGLINDLDLTVQTPTGVSHLPWILQTFPDATLLAEPATTGADHINNVEQIVINEPEEGYYPVKVKGNLIPFGHQPFYIVYEFVSENIQLTFPYGGECLVPGTTEYIQWDAFGDNGNFLLEYSLNGGDTWEIIGEVPGNQRLKEWNIPNAVTGIALVRISRNGWSSLSYSEFNIIGIPQHLTIEKVCPAFTKFSWDPVEGADYYVIYKLGTHFMDSILTVNTLYADVPIENPDEEDWFAVAARNSEGIEGQRTLAISNGEGVMNCIIEKDLEVVNISMPNSHIFQSCFDEPNTVSINIKNAGTEFLIGFPLYYQYDEEPVIEEWFPGSIPPGIVINYIFNNPFPAGQSGHHKLKVWTGLTGDEAKYNDSLAFELDVIPGIIKSLPYFESFDNFEICDKKATCEYICSLNDGWSNEPNGFGDDIDWRVNRGPTPSNETGPPTDQNTNSPQGAYLYLESSNGCFNQQSNLHSVCIDLGSSVAPTLNFWYHMHGNDIGKLTVDLFDGQIWNMNVIIPLQGHQSTVWQRAAVDLTSFAGKTISIRFRGVTGDDFLSDIAIDNIAVFDAFNPPYTAFTADRKISCGDQPVQFFDNSVNNPQTWQWQFSPATVTYLNGTHQNSPSPLVLFNETGTYKVMLFTANSYGNDLLEREGFITIDNGYPIPFVEDFESPIFPPQAWTLDNPDDYITWTDIVIPNLNGILSTSAVLNNYSYNVENEQDALKSITLDLTDSEEPFLRFDVAYTAYDNFYKDQLMVSVAVNCSDEYNHIIFDKTGLDLATANLQTNGWAPDSEEDWRTEIVDLKDFVGQTISLKFTNVSGYGNNLYLDNIIVYENRDFPQSDFIIEPDQFYYCKGESLTFSNIATSGMTNNFIWSFGEHAIPPTANTPGPHIIQFPEPGIYEVSLITANHLGMDKQTQLVEIHEEPEANFTFEVTNSWVAFNNLSKGGGTMLWDFGDGQTSEIPNPNHLYTVNSTYLVTLTQHNACGVNAVSKEVLIDSGSDNPNEIYEIELFPNPASTYFDLKFSLPREEAIKITCFDTKGSLIEQKEALFSGGTTSQRFEIFNYANGIYFLKIQIGDHVVIKKLAVAR